MTAGRLVRPPLRSGEESGAEVRLPSERGEERLPSGRGEEQLVPPPEGEGEGAWPATSAPPLRLVPPPEGEGEGARLTTSAPPGVRPSTSAPPLYPPLPSSSKASPLPSPSDGGQNELQGKKACDLFQLVLQSLQDMSLQFQHMSIVTNPPHRENEASSPRCLAGPPAPITPARWSGVIRDAILDGQCNVATIIRDTQALACPVVQVNG